MRSGIIPVVPKKKPPPDLAKEEQLDRAVVGALRDAIHAHGPITPKEIGSAAKRIRGAFRQAVQGATGTTAAEMARRRWAGTTTEERRKIAAAGGRKRWKGTTAAQRSRVNKKVGAAGGRSAWANMTAEERSAEMKKRAAKRAARKR